jgi:hypothetical protein
MTQKPDGGLYERLDEIKQIVSDMRSEFSAFCVRVNRLEDIAKENKEAIKGNGKTGLEERASLVEAQLTQIRWIGGAIALMVVGDIVTRLLQVIK